MLLLKLKRYKILSGTVDLRSFGSLRYRDGAAAVIPTLAI